MHITISRAGHLRSCMLHELNFLKASIAPSGRPRQMSHSFSRGHFGFADEAVVYIVASLHLLTSGACIGLKGPYDYLKESIH